MRDDKGRFVKGFKPEFTDDHKLKISEGLKKAHAEKGYSKKEKNPNWKGGRYKDIHGYIWVRVEDDHPYSYRGYIREHRRVVELDIGRYLKPEERVHHINYNKVDNRIENLQLLASESEHQKLHAMEGTGAYSK